MDLFEQLQNARAIAPDAPVEVQNDPIQVPGVDAHVQRAQIGGPTSGMDVRLAISIPILEALLAVAQRSTTHRAVVYGVGFRLTGYNCRGHIYQIMTLLGKHPVPEMLALIGVEETPDEDVFKEAHIIPPGFDPGQKMGERIIGGPEKDLRLYLSVPLLETMLGRARASRTKRAVIHGAGLVLDLYRTPTGALYQVVTVAGRMPVPEDPAVITTRS